MLGGAADVARGERRPASASATLAASSVTCGPARGRGAREREAHAPGGAVADEADAVDRLAGAAGGDEHAHAAQRPARAARRAPRSAAARIRSGSASRADAALALGGQAARRRARRCTTPRSRSVCRFACVAGCSYMRLFIAGASTSGQLAASARAGEHVVGEPGRELGDRVRGRRRDHVHLGLRDELQVADRVVRRRLLAGERAAGGIALELARPAPAPR